MLDRPGRRLLDALLGVHDRSRRCRRPVPWARVVGADKWFSVFLGRCGRQCAVGPGRHQYHLLALKGVERSGRIKAWQSANELNNPLKLKLGGAEFGRDLVDNAEVRATLKAQPSPLA